MTLQHTALYAEHEKLGASFTDFGGWQMPLKYSSELGEHHAVRNAAGLFDLSHMGEVWVTGPEAAELLDYALVGKLSAIKVGKAKYSLICNEDGGILDDLITYRLAEDRFLVVPNASNAPTVAAAFQQRAANFDAVVDDQSLSTSLIALQGPKAEAILLRLVAGDQADAVRELRYYAAIELRVAGIDVLLARTGYTGEDGFELMISNSDAVALWTQLLETGADDGLKPAGLACRDSLRLEAGMPLYGHELNVDITPAEAGMGKIVSYAKDGDFVGRAALEPAKDVEPEHVLVGLRGTGRRAARAGYGVHVDGADVAVGEVTSGAPSPTLGYPIALAYVERSKAAEGTELTVDLRGKREPFIVVKPPFYRREK
ncbi:glycine cleavage system aminomethyltransferase GcvT [Saxibacter everestensis]|uniref:Aminomethyltransferase n=1 Tax=Saxibacter everestensis TaxID=2909229 RepID=A0ABY8QT47_9MICO|nr:glycine cleavage system aminomethyltransferase GcvT [Brevibacteriaceae bacterium ZFBP1038]